MPIFDETFWTSEQRNLSKPTLRCLIQDAALYTTLLFQVREDISYDQHGIWMTDSARAAAKFNDFFDLALRERAALAVTPNIPVPGALSTSASKTTSFAPLATFGSSAHSPSPLTAWLTSSKLILKS